MAKTSEFERALMSRDGISRAEAKRQRDEARDMLYDIMADEGDYDDVEDMLACEYGLEMDYIFDLL